MVAENRDLIRAMNDQTRAINSQTKAIERQTTALKDLQLSIQTNTIVGNEVLKLLKERQITLKENQDGEVSP